MDRCVKPRIVLSGVNFVEAGPLAIMQDALRSVAEHFPEYEVHALVHRAELYPITNVIFHEYPEVKRSWLNRLRFEYFDSLQISREIKPHLWLAMHDITPRVEAERQAVYCHNPAPFYRVGLREALLSYKFTLFSLLYRYLYGVFIGRNDFVVVQQNWMRQAFRQRYRVREVVVAHPSVAHLSLPEATAIRETSQPFRLFYPAFARSFKNVEVLLEACRSLERSDVELRLTMDGSENRYAAQLRERFGDLGNVCWLGAMPREAVLQQYADVDALVFPSRLETWGMPLTEFKATGKPILAADLPYAHETVGSYGAVGFLPPSDASAWAEAMEALSKGRPAVGSVVAAAVEPPFVESWKELFVLLLQ